MESGESCTASEKFEEEARRWKQSGEVSAFRLDRYGYIRLRFWLASEGALADRVNDLLWKYGEEVEQRVIEANGRGWFGGFMESRDHCSLCGESYSVGNMSFCTHCETALGYCHQFSGGKAGNGNAKCPVCETGEIVWETLNGSAPGVSFRVEKIKSKPGLWEWLAKPHGL